MHLNYQLVQENNNDNYSVFIYTTKYWIVTLLFRLNSLYNLYIGLHFKITSIRLLLELPDLKVHRDIYILLSYVYIFVVLGHTIRPTAFDTT